MANILHVAPGDILTVEVREGRQPVLNLPVRGVAESLLGSPAYMDMEALNRVLREPGRVSGAILAIDSGQADAIYRALQDMPTVAGVSLKADARNAFKVLMDTGAGAIRYVMGAVASSPSALSTTLPASPMPNAPAIWPACGSSALPRARPPLSSWANWPPSP